jgi:hypothetical protein
MAITKTDRARATDHDMMLVGLAGIGVRLYAEPNEAPLGSILEAERAVFARHFDSVWSTLTNDDHRWLREKLDDEDGAFAHMMAAYESRTRTVSVLPDPAATST